MIDSSPNERSYEELERQYSRMLQDIAGKYGAGLDRDDAVQELRLVLWAAQRLWSPVGGAAFTTYLYRACINRCRKMHGRLRAKFRVPERLCESLDSMELGREAPDLPVEDDHSLFELLNGASAPAVAVAARILMGLPERQWRAFSAFNAQELNQGKEELIKLLKGERNE